MTITLNSDGLQGKIVVVKFGGNAMTDEALKRAFAEDMVSLLHAGVQPVVVHGGGPQITAMLKKLGIPGEFKGGFRVTTPEVLVTFSTFTAGCPPAPRQPPCAGRSRGSAR